MKNTLFLIMIFILYFNMIFAQKDPVTNSANLNLSKSNINKSASAGKRQYKPYHFRLCVDGTCCIVFKSNPDAPQMYYKWDVKKATYTKIAAAPQFGDAKIQTKTMVADDWQVSLLFGINTGPCKPPYMCEFMADATNSLSYIGTCDASGVCEIKFGVNSNGIPVLEGSAREHTVVIGLACPGGAEKMGKPQKIDVK